MLASLMRIATPLAFVFGVVMILKMACSSPPVPECRGGDVILHTHSKQGEEE
jgi:hypothetical protein